MSNIKLSNSCSIEKYLKFKSEQNKDRIATLLYERLNERFISPILDANEKENGHGFAMMAIACFTIEAFQSFVDGDISSAHNERVSARTFERFFITNSSFKINKAKSNSFYHGVRNGLVHDAETRNGWRILRTGPICDNSNKTINATKFLKELRLVIFDYSESLKSLDWDDTKWKNVIIKFDSIVKKTKK